jgi:hypothetical protein
MKPRLSLSSSITLACSSNNREVQINPHILQPQYPPRPLLLSFAILFAILSLLFPPSHPKKNSTIPCKSKNRLSNGTKRFQLSISNRAILGIKVALIGRELDTLHNRGLSPASPEYDCKFFFHLFFFFFQMPYRAIHIFAKLVRMLDLGVLEEGLRSREFLFYRVLALEGPYFRGFLF